MKTHRKFPARGALATLAASLVCISSVHASTCPFDTGGSDAVNDGVVLTRYALGITGVPLVASTRPVAGEKQHRVCRLCARHEW